MLPIARRTIANTNAVLFILKIIPEAEEVLLFINVYKQDIKKNQRRTLVCLIKTKLIN